MKFSPALSSGFSLPAFNKTHPWGGGKRIAREITGVDKSALAVAMPHATLPSRAARGKLFFPLVLPCIRRGCVLLLLLAGFLFSYLLVGCSFIMSVLSPKINYHEIGLARYLPKWHLPSSASFQCERNKAAPAGRWARPPGHPPALPLAELPLSLPSPLPVPCSLLCHFLPFLFLPPSQS